MNGGAVRYLIILLGKILNYSLKFDDIRKWQGYLQGLEEVVWSTFGATFRGFGAIFMLHGARQWLPHWAGWVPSAPLCPLAVEGC